MPAFIEKKVRKKNETVVLLHGLGGDLSVWQPLVKILNQLGYSCISLDLRGHGKSSRPGKLIDYDFDRLGQDVIEVMEAEGSTSVILVGHCLGAIVAQHAAIARPEKISKLILLAPTYKTYAWAKLINSKNLLIRIGGRIAELLPSSHYQRRFDSHQFWRGTTDFSGRRLAGDLARTSLRSYSFLTLNVLKLDIADRLVSAAGVKSLIIMGKKDHVIPPSIAEEYRLYWPQTEIHYLEKTNHQLLFNNFNLVAKKLAVWIEK